MLSGCPCEEAGCGGEAQREGSTRDEWPFPGQLMLFHISCNNPGKSLARLFPQAIRTILSGLHRRKTHQSAGAPGIPLPGAGTSTAFLSSVSPTHCSTSRASRSTSSSVFSVGQNEGMSNKEGESTISTLKESRFLLPDIHTWLQHQLRS